MVSLNPFSKQWRSPSERSQRAAILQFVGECTAYGVTEFITKSLFEADHFVNLVDKLWDECGCECVCVSKKREVLRIQE